MRTMMSIIPYQADTTYIRTCCLAPLSVKSSEGLIVTTTKPNVVPKSRFIREYRKWRRKALAGEEVYVTRCGKDATLQIYLTERDYDCFIEKLGDEFATQQQNDYKKRHRYKIVPGIVKGWDDALA